MSSEPLMDERLVSEQLGTIGKSAVACRKYSSSAEENFVIVP